jgi:ParB family transcriptional regulator, chromosome partitioning protein
MTNSSVLAIPLSEITIANPRPRSKYIFDQIVTSISTVGLKTPITVSMREKRSDGTQYDLVCGQGRLEAFLTLGQTAIPAIVINASREDQYLMSLIENIARRPPSQLGLLKETKSLRERGYSIDEIAVKLGLGSRYIATIVMLLGNGETELIRRVETGMIPLTVASEIANGTSRDIQRALTEAYESGELRGAKLKTVRAIIRRRNLKPIGARKQKPQPKAPLTSQDMAREYQEHTRIQRVLVKRAAVVRERLVLVGAACRQLFADPNFVTLLRAENLSRTSEKLIELTREQ